MFFLADVIEALTNIRPAGASLAISEAAIDSRQIIPSALFVALVGERVDGHDYIGEAFKRGACLALVQHPVEGYPLVDLRSALPADFSLPQAPFCLLVEDTLKALQVIAAFWRGKLPKLEVIGITGSVGKSTTKELIYDVLSQQFRTLKSPGNMNNEIGLPLSLLRLGRGHQRAVLEMGFYVPGEIAFLCDLAKPRIGVITNIGTVHAERAGSQEAIARGKSELVQALPEDGVAILNYDDPWVRPMAEKTRARVFYYGLDENADLWADHIEGQGLEGIKFRLHYQKEILHLRAPLIGRHSVHTILRATAVGLMQNMTWQDIISGLQQGRNQLRLVAVHTQSGALLLDDTYNASPESTLAALNLLEELEGRKVAVLGDMLELGPYEKQGHRLVGARVAEVCNQLVAVGPRSKTTVQAAQQAGMPASAITWFEQAPDAIVFLKEQLQKGDTALVKGSLGMGMARIVNALEIES
ncbi:MAG: UDP-N-acetylmuramoyl-tripeptide--D-alanyl-D-alanine ligase [Anaerolineae bacterium]|nr:UDP-N-acetylmuramoyl-tripeptide--D-alanyl-D-alanine ligase [Anaerolineae bacterium]